MEEAKSESLELAERVVDRLCHDYSSAGQALASSLDLLNESTGQAQRDEAIALLGDALAAQSLKVAFARRVYGSAGQMESTDLKVMCDALFADRRATLDWALGESRLEATGTRSLLLLVEIASQSLAAGGVAHLAADAHGVVVEMTGARVTLRDEVRAGLAGIPFAAGLGGRWVQGAFLRALARSAGGDVEVRAREGFVSLRVNLPGARSG